MTSTASRTGLQFLHDIAYKYHGMPTAAQASGLPDYFTGFQKQRYGMAFMGPWALDYAFGKKPGGQSLINFKWGAVVTPKGPKSRQAVMASTGLVISKHSSHKSAAFWLARFDSEGNGAVLTGAYGVDMPGAKALWSNKADRRRVRQVAPEDDQEEQRDRPLPEAGATVRQVLERHQHRHAALLAEHRRPFSR